MNQREGRQGGTKGSWKRWREEGRNRERGRERERGKKGCQFWHCLFFLSLIVCPWLSVLLALSLSPFPSLCPSEWSCQASRAAGKNMAHCGLQTPCRLATSCWPLTADLCTLVVCWGLWTEQECVCVCVCVCVCACVCVFVWLSCQPARAADYWRSTGTSHFILLSCHPGNTSAPCPLPPQSSTHRPPLLPLSPPSASTSPSTPSFLGST